MSSCSVQFLSRALTEPRPDDLETAFKMFSNDQTFLFILDAMGWNADAMVDGKRLVVHALEQKRYTLIGELYQRGARISGQLAYQDIGCDLFRLFHIRYSELMKAYFESGFYRMDLDSLNVWIGVGRLQKKTPLGKFLRVVDPKLVLYLATFVMSAHVRPWEFHISRLRYTRSLPTHD